MSRPADDAWKSIPPLDRLADRPLGSLGGWPHGHEMTACLRGREAIFIFVGPTLEIHTRFEHHSGRWWVSAPSDLGWMTPSDVEWTVSPISAEATRLLLERFVQAILGVDPLVAFAATERMKVLSYGDAEREGHSDA